MSQTPTNEQTVGAGEALEAFFKGIGFILVTPRVWGYAAVPVLMGVLLTCAVGGLGLYGGNWASHALLGEHLEGWSQAGGWAVMILLGLLSLVLGVFIALVLAQPLSGWALEGICRAQERSLTGDCSPEPSFLSSLWLSGKVALFTAVAGGGILGCLFLITFFIPPAVVITVPLKFLVAAWLIAWNLVDYPLSLRGLGLRQRIRWAARHFDAFTAFGAAWAVVLVVPGIALFVLPMGVAGATRLVVAAGE